MIEIRPRKTGLKFCFVFEWIFDALTSSVPVRAWVNEARWCEQWWWWRQQARQV
jgi:hypothetical protein